MSVHLYRYMILAGAPDTTDRLIAAYPAQLQRTNYMYVSLMIIANCKLKLIPARLPSIHTIRFARKVYILQPVIPLETISHSPHHALPTHPRSI
jgi:hypothetical protein